MSDGDGFFPLKREMQGTQLIPPFAGVSLVEYRDRIELRPYCWCREFVGLGKIRGSEVPENSASFFTSMFRKLFWRRSVWVIVCWRRYEDGREEALRTQYISPDATEDEARREFDRHVRFTQLPREELEELLSLYVATPDDVAYAESRPSRKELGMLASETREETDVYQARLKALAGLAPQTVSLNLRLLAPKPPRPSGKASSPSTGSQSVVFSARPAPPAGRFTPCGKSSGSCAKPPPRLRSEHGHGAHSEEAARSTGRGDKDGAAVPRAGRASGRLGSSPP